MPKVPRDLAGRELVRLLHVYGYTVVRQAGSHIQLTSALRVQRHVLTIPDHHPIRIGTLNAILYSVSNYLGITKSELINALFHD